MLPFILPPKLTFLTTIGNYQRINYRKVYCTKLPLLSPPPSNLSLTGIPSNYVSLSELQNLESSTIVLDCPNPLPTNTNIVLPLCFNHRAGKSSYLVNLFITQSLARDLELYLLLVTIHRINKEQ